MNKPIIYQMLPRLWGADKTEPQKNGSLSENGCGTFKDIDKDTLDYLHWLGCTHVWFTGVIRHATAASERGCTPSNSQFVKGNAGSPYAICDYYDVNPYLAEEPEHRLEEFSALLARTHQAGLKAIIDFVPNHVSRDYGKVPGTVLTSGMAAPQAIAGQIAMRDNHPVTGVTHPVLGAEDDKTVHWKPENDFFYYPGQALKLPVPPAEGEKAYVEEPAMATGNNCFQPDPSINDWYETIKINYCDFHTATWDKMYDIVRYWASQGVDGFRCDMVELVPPQFFTWLIRKVKEEFPEVIFIAEVYSEDLYKKYIREVGFDYLYDKSGLYDTLRTVVEKNVMDTGMPLEMWQSTTGITRNWQQLGDLQPYLLNFLENHDEQRFASDFFGKSADNEMAALHVSLLLNNAPFMIYAGQEVGERGMEEEGFSGRDGRTTIFDWWTVGSLRRLRKAIAAGAYRELDPAALEAAGLQKEEAEFFCRFAGLMRFARQEKAVTEGTFYDLCYSNYGSEGFDKHRHYIFLRDFEEQTILVAVNFSNKDAVMKIHIPQHAWDWMGITPTEQYNPSQLVEIKIPAMGAEILRVSE